jgi:hypothetical protein
MTCGKWDIGRYIPENIGILRSRFCLSVSLYAISNPFLKHLVFCLQLLVFLSDCVNSF